MTSLRQKLNQVNKYLSSYRGGSTSRFIPDTILLEPTSICNLHCIHCYRESKIHEAMQLQNRTMEMATFQRVLDQLFPYLKRITFAGYGEPLIHPGLPEMTDYASRRGISVRMISNGILWTPKRTEQMVSAGIDQVSFSLDAATEDTYRKIRQGDWQKAVEGIQCFEQFRRDRSSQTGFILYHVLNRLNIHETAAMVRMGYELGADSINFGPVRTEKILPDDEMTLERGDRGEILHFLHEGLAEDTRNITNLQDSIRVFEDSEVPYRSGTAVCYSPWTDLMVLTDGSIQPCCNYFGLAGNYIFGNINRQQFQEIWNGEEYRKFRRDFVHNRVCDWCRLYPGIDRNRVYERIQITRSLVPFLKIFSKRKNP